MTVLTFTLTEYVNIWCLKLSEPTQWLGTQPQEDTVGKQLLQRLGNNTPRSTYSYTMTMDEMQPAVFNQTGLGNGMNMSDDDWRLLQPLWDLRFGYESYLASPLFPIITSVVFYFVVMLPWTMIDLYGKNWNWMQKYKIQDDKEVTWPQIRKAILLTVWNHMIYILPLSVGQWVYTPPSVLPPIAPTIWEFIWHQMASLAVFDFEYFVWHSTHHKFRFLYRAVHSLHHQYSSPSSWVTQYLHPWELISVGFFTTTSPWLFDAHPLTCWSFQQFAILVSVEAHIGYDFPILPHHWFPFWAGVTHHDMHHQKPLTNFSPFFTYWDHLAGSFCPGQMAGGVQPKALLDWEKQARQKKADAKAKREAANKVKQG